MENNNQGNFTNFTNFDNIIIPKNPRERPFGILNNDAIHYMSINDMKWATVSNYIFSNMLINPLYRLSIQVADTQGSTKSINAENKINQLVKRMETAQKRGLRPEEVDNIKQMVMSELQLQEMNIRQLYEHYLYLEKEHVLRTGVEKVYRSLIYSNRDLQQILIDTGDNPIIYVSNDNILGNGGDGTGKNFIGLTLMQIRKNIKALLLEDLTRQQKEQEENKIFEIYYACRILENKLKFFKNDLAYIKEDFNKSPSEIIEEYDEAIHDIALQDYHKEFKVIVDDNMKPDIITLYKAGKLPYINTELTRPNTLANEFYQHIMDKQKQKNIQLDIAKLKKEVLMLYTKLVITSKFPNLNKAQVDLAASQLIYTMPVVPNKNNNENYDKYIQLENLVFNLYAQGKIPYIKKALGKTPENIKNLEAEDRKLSSTSNSSGSSSASSSSSESSSSSSSSSSSENPIKIALGDDEKAQKKFLINKLVELTGYSEDQFKNLSIVDLQKKVTEYTGGNIYNPDTKEWQYIPPKKSAKKGYWLVELVYTSSRNNIKYNKKVIVGTVLSAAPPKNEIDKLVNMYFTNNFPADKLPAILNKKTRVFWSAVPMGEYISSDKNNYNEPEYRSALGQSDINMITPIEITDDIKTDLKMFVPTYQQDITVGNMVYPCVSIYLYTMLLTHTGSEVRNTKRGIMIFRGMSETKARNIMLDNNIFNNPGYIQSKNNKNNKNKNSQPIEPIPVNRYCYIEKASKIYIENFNKTQENLYETFNRIGIQKKFEDKDLQNILLLTGDADLIYPNNKYAANELTKIREKIKVYRASHPYPIVNRDDDAAIKKFMTEDSFMKSWILMKLNEMCLVVRNADNYLINIGQPNKIDARFVEVVLDTIYKHCSMLSADSKKITIPAPEIFVAVVKTCSGITVNYAKDYIKEIRNLENQLEELENNYFNIKPLDPSLIENPEKAAQGLRKIIRNREFEKKQADDWYNFVTELYSPDKKALATADAKIKAFLDRKNKKLAEAHGTLTKIDIDKKLNKEWNSLINDLNSSSLTQVEKNNKLNQFIQQQENERKNFYNLKDIHTAAERDQYEKRKKILYENKEELIIAKNKDDIKYQAKILSIAQEYWNRIVVMVKYLVAKSNNSLNQQDIRKLIMLAEKINSTPVICSINEADKLNDDFNTCVASAIFNIIIGINKFKYEYKDDLPPGKHDINLAVHILLGQPLVSIKEKKAKEGKSINKPELQAPSQEQVPPQAPLLPAEEDTGDAGDAELIEQLNAALAEEELKQEEEALESSRNETEEDFIDKDNGEEEYDYEDETIEEEADRDIGDRDIDGSFGMGKPNNNTKLKRRTHKLDKNFVNITESDRVKISNALSQIYAGKIIPDMVDFVNNIVLAISQVKNAKTPQHVKLNRINFFASLM